ncbi:MAG: TldD/PmbA family protein, partial [Theionarchaea archaeon]|nr:TldD/PmbA family protein [Theionarchaea archaeon]
YLAGVGEQGNEVTGSCADYVFSHTADIHPEKVGETVKEKVLCMFNPRPLKSFKGTIIFGPEACSYQIADAVIDALKGESVMAGHSFWAQKTGEKVASDLVTVTDDGLLENGYSSRGFDDEGYPSQRTPLLKKGVLTQYLQCASTAQALQVINTGNACRSPGGFDMIRNIIGSGYRTIPEVYPSNLVIEPGTKSKETLISEVDTGVLIESMAGFTQKGSGLISAQLSRAFFIHKGEIQYPIKNGMVSGVAFDWLKNVSGVGNDVKQFDATVIPSIRVEDVSIVGQ